MGPALEPFKEPERGAGRPRGPRKELSGKWSAQISFVDGPKKLHILRGRQGFVVVNRKDVLYEILSLEFRRGGNP